MAEKTGAEAGLDADALIRVALETMVAKGGRAQMAEIYAAVNAAMKPDHLSTQGEATLRTYINRDAVKANLVLAHDKGNPGWEISAEGREFLQSMQAANAMIDELEVVDAAPSPPTSQARALAFEKYILEFMKVMYPEYAWYHQGVHKAEERGLDMVGTRLRPVAGEPRVIGVQVKCHAEEATLAKMEWFQFLAGCYARRVNSSIFVTTGRMNGKQRREAAEAQVVVIEGSAELSRLAKQFGITSFDEWDTSLNDES